MANITTSKWEAWINIMPIQPTPDGTLHVIGEVDTHSADFAFLEKAIPQGKNDKILLLNLKVETGIAPATNPQRVHYTEALQKKDQYTNIEILHKGKSIASIRDIKIVQ